MRALVLRPGADTPILRRRRAERDAARRAPRGRPHHSGPSAPAGTAATSRPRCAAHWSTPSSRRTGCTLEDGTELVTSGDHRFLTNRGWKHVTGDGAGRRAAAAPDTGERAARHGRLRRAAARDRRLSPRLPVRHGPRRRDARLAAVRRPTAAVDAPPLPPRARRRRGARRARRYLPTPASTTGEFAFQRPRRARRRGRRRSAPSGGPASSASRELIAWPTVAGDDWRKGFLAGIFDAEGSLRRRRAAHREHRSGRSSTGRSRLPARTSASTPSRRSRATRTACAYVRAARRAARAAAVLPH